MVLRRPTLLLVLLALVLTLVVVRPETAEAAGSYPGRPQAGQPLWGASIHGNGDPVARHEKAAGATLGVRRTFYQWSHRTSYMPSVARQDVASGRLPWVSVKTPGWNSMASGARDRDIDQMLRALDAIDGPVWLTVHHEPEGGGGTNRSDDPGGPSAHVAMNRRVRQRMNALKTDNIALASILMGWTWNPRSGRDPEQWFAPGIYDFIGVDHYQDKEASLLTDNWSRIRRWARSKGLDVAVGEWGMRGTDTAAGQRVREWYDAAARSHRDGRGARVVALSAFDSGLNAPTGSWELKGKQRTLFRRIMADARRDRAASDPKPPSPSPSRSTSRFQDVRADSPYASDIVRLAKSGITTGCNSSATRFCPKEPVTRQEMAAFIRRAEDLRQRAESFRDVPSSSAFARDIGGIAAAGITRGCNPPGNTRFCPHAKVTRREMAAFISRSLGLRGARQSFGDVPSSNAFSGDIGAIARAGITRGCNPPKNTRFCPNDIVTREQMAAFIVRGWDL